MRRCGGVLPGSLNHLRDTAMPPAFRTEKQECFYHKGKAFNTRQMSVKKGPGALAQQEPRDLLTVVAIGGGEGAPCSDCNYSEDNI